MRNDFTLFLRKYPNGKEVYFYYTYDGDGKRRGPWTAKSRGKTEARNYCNRLVKSGGLIPDRKKAVTFGEYACGFWGRKSEYVVYQESWGEISDSYIASGTCVTENQLLPFFGETPLDKITVQEINKWLPGFKRREIIVDGEKKIREYKNSFANSALRILSVMLKNAVRRGLIQTNSCAGVRALKNERKEIEIVTAGEVKNLFPADFKKVWGDNETAYAANLLACLTGMRIGEILGLRGEFVFDNYIAVCGQFGIENRQT